MDSVADLRKSLLEDRRRQYGGAQDAFARDLRIAVILLVVFQFVTFAKSIQLIEQLDTLRQQQDRIAADLQSLVTINALKRERFVRSVVQGRTDLDVLVQRVPCAFQELEVAMTHAVFGETATASFPCSLELGIDPSSALPVEEIHELGQNAYVSSAFETMASLIYAALNGAQHRLIQIHVIEWGIDYLADLERQATILEARGYFQTNSEVREEIEISRASWEDKEANALAKSISFGPTDIDCPESTIEERYVNDVEYSLSRTEYEDDKGLIVYTIASANCEIDSISSRLNYVIEFMPDAQITQNKILATVNTRISVDLATVQSQIDDIRENYAKPLPGAVVLDPRDAVLYYPVVLAVVFAYFSWRYSELKRRGEDLFRTLKSAGLSDDELNSYLPSVGEQGFQSWTWLLAGIPGFLAAVSVAAIVSSTSLGRDDRQLYVLYLLVLVLLVWSYIPWFRGARQWYLRRSGSRSMSRGRTSDWSLRLAWIVGPVTGVTAAIILLFPTLVPQELPVETAMIDELAPEPCGYESEQITPTTALPFESTLNNRIGPFCLSINTGNSRDTWLFLEWTIRDVTTCSRVDEDGLNNQPFASMFIDDSGRLIPSVQPEMYQQNHATFNISLPAPQRDGEFFAVLELYNSRGRLLDSDSSRTVPEQNCLPVSL